MFKSILCAIDGSSYTQSVLNCGVDLAKKFTSELRLISIVDIRMFEWVSAIALDGFVPAIPGPNYLRDSRDVLEAKAKSTLEKGRAFIETSDLTHSAKVEFGVPSDIICEEAKKSDLVIMGRRGEFASWSGQLVGATLEAVSHDIPRPLVVVNESYSPLERIICAYDGSECASRALKTGVHMASMINAPISVVSVGKPENTTACLDEAKEYCDPYSVNTEFLQKEGDLLEVLTALNLEKESAYTLMGSHGKSRIREAILGSTTVEILRKLNYPVIIQK